MDGCRTLSTKHGAQYEERRQVMPLCHTRADVTARLATAAVLCRGLIRLARAVELTFLGDPLKGFIGAFDAVLMLVAIRRQKFHDLISPIGGHMTKRLRREIDRLTEPKLMCVHH
jgi:hypothetical protein